MLPIIEQISRNIMQRRGYAYSLQRKPPVLAVYIDRETDMEMRSQMRGHVSAWCMGLIEEGTIDGCPVYLVTPWFANPPEPHGWKVLEIG